MIKESLLEIYETDLNKLKEEINLFAVEKDLWITPEGIKNSAGNLCLHICGNLKHFIGSVLGNTGYVREREKEFSFKNVPRIELLNNVDETLKAVFTTIKDLDENIFEVKYPIEVFGYEMRTEKFLIHLAGHLNYHLGQINYLRRFLVD